MIEKEDHHISERLRLSLRQLEVFVATAHAGSTRGGAERVARSQSAASSALADLESALGVQLFDRVGRRLMLNENGRALLPRAQSLLDQSLEMQALFIGEHAAPLRVAASFTIGEYLLPERISEWTVLHPESQVRLQIANTRDVIEAVAAFDVDVGFIEGTQTHSELIVRPWLDDELVIVAAPGHPLARQRASARQLGRRDLGGARAGVGHAAGHRCLAAAEPRTGPRRLRAWQHRGDQARRRVGPWAGLPVAFHRRAIARGPAPGRSAHRAAEGGPQARDRGPSRQATGPGDDRLRRALRRCRHAHARRARRSRARAGSSPHDRPEDTGYCARSPQRQLRQHQNFLLQPRPTENSRMRMVSLPPAPGPSMALNSDGPLTLLRGAIMKAPVSSLSLESAWVKPSV